MQLDANAYQKIIAESAAEITAMQQALGHG
jgi:hypothetical protein